MYRSEQATRGAQVIAEHCATCHAENMRGGPGAPGMVGAEFMFNWSGKTAGELFEYLRTSMPPGQLGVLSDDQYADIMAAILQGNGFPPSPDNGLSADRETLDRVLITQQP
jgi:alcohol dehydrogenase (cytochrome c)